MIAEDYTGAARLKAAYEDEDEVIDFWCIDFCVHLERPNYRLQGLQPVCARACLQGKTFKQSRHLGNLLKPSRPKR